MSFSLIKSIIAILLLGAAGAAAFSMLRLLGKPAGSSSPAKSRVLHRAAGWSVVGLALTNGILGFLRFTRVGDALASRAVIHAYLALTLLALLFLKIAIVRSFRTFLRMAPALGMTMFVLGFVLVLASAGYFGLRSALVAGSRGGPTDGTAAPAASALAGDAANGEAIFQGLCSGCHYSDRLEAKTGPGLKGLFRREALPSSGRPATPENVAFQLRRPWRSMPPFPSLIGQDLSDLLAYLRAL